jgi:ribonuclease P protein component
MIPKNRRLPLSRTVKFSGRRLSGRFSTLLTAPNNLPHYRAAIIISKKVIPLAVNRHQLKRHLASILVASLNVCQPQDWLVILRPAAAKVLPQEVVGELLLLIEQACAKP